MALEKRANKGGGGASQHVFKTPGRVEFFRSANYNYYFRFRLSFWLTIIIIMIFRLSFWLADYFHFDICLWFDVFLILHETINHFCPLTAIPKSPVRRLASHTVSSPSQISSPILQSPPKMCSHGNIPINNTGNQPTFHSLVTANNGSSSPVKPAGSNLTNGSLQSHPIGESVSSQDNEMSEVIPLVNGNKTVDNCSDSSDMSQTIPLLCSPGRKTGETKDYKSRSGSMDISSSDQMSEEELLLHLSESEWCLDVVNIF